jgi:predicted alpha/beta superfamily hydrolase
MKHFLCLIFISCTWFYGLAQYRVVIQLENYPAQHGKDSIFISGSFNGWKPGDTAYKLISNAENVSGLTLNLPAGYHEFKCTRGTWTTAEYLVSGNEVENRRIHITGDTSFMISIEAWKDDFPEPVKKHTATSQVHMADSSFFMPQLNRYRRIRIYLPEGYAKSKKKYPVMYMHDGQNLFDDSTAAFGEWGVDECLDSLIKKNKPACIVVGIDNGPQRFNEYNPYDFQQFGKGEGDLYLEFLVQTLKPFIDKQYRTNPAKENTIIAGSSMGGLISYYAMLQYPGVFGKAGVFSPAFWTAPQIKNVTESLSRKVNGKFFFYMGGKEGGTPISDMQEVQEILGERSQAMVYSVIDAESGHNEQAWRKWFAEFYTWIMADGYNTVIKVKD